LVLVVGPHAAASVYVRQEWQFAWFEAEKVVTPILRLGDYATVPDELKLLHCEDFRDDQEYAFHLDQLDRILRAPPPPLGKLIAVPSLPRCIAPWGATARSPARTRGRRRSGTCSGTGRCCS